MIEITAYKKAYFDELTSYQLNEEQSQFSRTPIEVLSDAANLSNEKLFHYCILFEEKAVGFFTLDFTENRFVYSTNPESVLLRSFSINPNFQGKGIAKSVMKQLPHFVKLHFKDVKEICFGVNSRNANAYQLYIKTGYLDSGKIFEGKKGPQNLMYKVWN